MGSDRAERFVSPDFRGVTVIKAQNPGENLLANRAAKKAAGSTPSMASRQLGLGKGDIVASVASAAGLSKDQAKLAVDGLLETISVALARGQDVSISGFGKFSVSKPTVARGRNPRTGKKIAVGTLPKLTFKAGKNLRDAVHDIE
jgi:DNA-binding protein HU-beta